MRFCCRCSYIQSFLLSVVACVALPTLAVAECYDLLGCSDVDDFAAHYDYLASVNSGPNCEFLWTMRNAILAEHKYCFQTARARSAFGTGNCRYQVLAKVPLNGASRANIATILRAERQKSCPQ